MKRIILHISHTFVASLLALFILGAVLFSFARVVSPLLSTQRESVEYWVSEALDRPVKIGSLEIIWRGLHPVIKSTRVIIFNKRNTHELLETDELDIGVDLLRTFLTGRARLGHIRIIGSHLTLKQRADDSISLIGIGTLSSQHLFAPRADILNELIDWLFSQPQISLQDITLKWFDKDGTQLPVHKINLILRNSRSHHILWGKAELAQTPSSNLSLIFDVKGNWHDREHLKAHFYFKGTDVMLGQWIKQTVSSEENIISTQPQIFESESPLQILSDTAFAPVATSALMSGRTNFELWGYWEHNQLQNIQTQFVVKDFKLATQHPFSITKLNANVFAERNKDNNWEFTSDVSSQDSLIGFGSMFPEPIPVDQLTSHIEGLYDAEGLSIQASRLYLKNSDGEIRGHAAMLFPKNAQSPILNVLAKIHFFGAEHVYNYLPRPVLKPNLIKWLTDSITHLQEADSTVIINGKIDDFPFDDGDGIFLVDSYLTNVELDYWKGWPAVTQFNGRLIFKGRRMEFKLDSGKFFSAPLNFNIPLTNIQAVIPLLKKDEQAVLSVKGNVNTTLTDGFNFLRATPLQGKMLDNIKKFTGQGKIKTQLNLTIPLEKGATPLQVAGAVNFMNNTLNIPVQNIKLENLSGLVSFTEDSVNAKGLTANIWDKPITLDMNTRYNNTDVTIHSGDLSAIIEPQGRGWKINLKSPGVSGRIGFSPSKRNLFKAHFQKFYVSDKLFDSSRKWLPSEVPNSCITIDDFRYNGKCFGKMQLRLFPIGDNLHIHLFHHGRFYSLAAQGLWYIHNGEEWTQLAGSLSTCHLNVLLRNWKLPEAITANNSIVNFNLIWPGAAYDPDFENMNGNFNLKFLNGKLLKLGASNEAKLNLGKLLNFLSIESLAHHLTLNFSDMNDKGFNFDTIEGSFTLNNGNAFTRDTQIKGQVANIYISGRVGIARKDYDLYVNVKPDVTASLPVIMAIVGGPVAGIVTWVANKILTPAFREITASMYHMTGSWHKPDIAKVNDLPNHTW